jgi:hypothetical protein
LCSDDIGEAGRPIDNIGDDTVEGEGQVGKKEADTFLEKD